jgi:post-segregation antitoxin (ccd killing protein)
MARIPDTELERLKREVSLLALVEAAGIALKRHGKDYLGLCPFHDDKEPSLVISPEKNLWHCLGACGEGGDVIAWVMKREGVSFRHAVEILQRNHPALAAQTEPTDSMPALSATSALTETFERPADEQALLDQVIDFYHETLKQSPEALDYLASRGLRDPELIERFGLGYANRTLAYRLPVAAVPPVPENPAQPEVTEHEVLIAYGERHYRVRGLQKNSSYEVLKINVLVRVGECLHVDSFDLYAARHRQAYARVAAAECGIEEQTIQRDLGRLLLQLESLQDQAIQAALKPKEPAGYTMEASERDAALALLRDPKLIERIAEAFAQTGLVGEPANALMGYLATVSRKLKTPLAIIVQSTSAAGKSALMDAVLRLVPEEDRVHYSAMTGQSLFYLGESDLKHKILGIAEEEGVRQAAYALKLLQSQGELTIASTGKDPQSGKLVTEAYRVEGPVMLFLTTTAIDIDEELLNRCVVLSINESREQTAAIQQRQRRARTLAGLLANNQAEQLIARHQNAQRLLRPLDGPARDADREGQTSTTGGHLMEKQNLPWEIEKIIEVAICLNTTGGTAASTSERIAAAFVLNNPI